MWSSRTLSVSARLTSIHAGGVGALCFDGKGNLLASAAQAPSAGPGDDQIALWAWRDCKLIKSVKGSTGAITSATFCLQGTYLATGGGTRVRMWRFTTLQDETVRIDQVGKDDLEEQEGIRGSLVPCEAGVVVATQGGTLAILGSHARVIAR